MGLQAAIRGLPVICVGFADYVVYPQFGLARAVDTLDQAMGLITEGGLRLPEKGKLPPAGNATQNVLAYVEDILETD